MNKSLSLVASSVLMVLSQSVSAIGVGQVKVKSFLNEPLELELPITGSNTTDVSVTMASYQQASRLGVTATGLHNYSATLIEDNGVKTIRITSSQPYKEPLADLAIVVRFPGGELVKGVTAFIDPAGLAVQPTKAAASVVNQNDAPVSTETKGDVVIVNPQATTGLPAAQTIRQQDNVIWGPTQRNDSLWKVASRLRNQYDVSLHQLMMAIFQANPNAFSNGRIDRLKMGYMLALPSAQQANRLSKSQAVALFTAASRGPIITKEKTIADLPIPISTEQRAVTPSVGTTGSVVTPENVALDSVTTPATPLPSDNQTSTDSVVAMQQRLQEAKALEQSLQQQNTVLKQQLDQVLARVDSIQARYADIEGQAQAQSASQPLATSETSISPVVEPVFVDPVASPQQANSNAPISETTPAVPKRNYGLYLLMFLGICSVAFISLLSFYIFKRRKKRNEFSEAFARQELESQPAVGQVVDKRSADTQVRQPVPPLDKVNKDSVQFDMVKTSAEAYFAYGRYKDAVELIEFEIKKRQEHPEFVRLLSDYLLDLQERINDAKSHDQEIAEYFVDEESQAELDHDDLQALQDSVLEELEQELKVSKEKLSKKAS